MGRVRVGLGSVATPLEDVVANIHSPSHTGFIILMRCPVQCCTDADAGG